MQKWFYKGVSNQLHSARHNYLHFYVAEAAHNNVNFPLTKLCVCVCWGGGTLKTERIHQTLVSWGNCFISVAVTKMLKGGEICFDSQFRGLYL